MALTCQSDGTLMEDSFRAEIRAAMFLGFLHAGRR